MRVFILVDSVDYEKDRIIACYDTIKKAIARKKKLQKQKAKYKKEMERTDWQSNVECPYYGSLFIDVRRIY